MEEMENDRQRLDYCAKRAARDLGWMVTEMDHEAKDAYGIHTEEPLYDVKDSTGATLEGCLSTDEMIAFLNGADSVYDQVRGFLFRGHI